MIKISNIICNNKLKLTSIAIITIISVMLSVPMPLLAKDAVDLAVNRNNNFNILVKIIFLFILIGIIQISLNFTLSLFTSSFSQNTVNKLRNKIYQTKINSQNVNLKNENSFITNIISDCDVLGSGIQQVLITLLSSLLSLIFYLLFFFKISFILASLTLILVPFFILLDIILSNISKKYFKKIQLYTDDLITHLLETKKGIILIKIYNVQEYFSNSLFNKTNNLKKISIKYNTVFSFISSIFNFLQMFSPLLILFVGLLLSSKGAITIGTVIACYSYSGLIFNPIMELMEILPIIKKISLSLERINKLLKNADEKYKNVNIINHKSNKFYLKKISIAYDEVNIINNFSYIFNYKNSYLLTGPNASGKSTLAKSLIKMIPIKSGEVYIPKKHKITYIPQNTYLFSGSILYNLTVGIKDFDNKYMQDLLSITNLGNELGKTKISINTFVDNENSPLSTGQIQKIKLIHALLSKPNILIIDEIMSNIDKKSQNRILNYLNEWVIKNNHMLLIISHDSNITNNLNISSKIVFPLK